MPIQLAYLAFAEDRIIWRRAMGYYKLNNVIAAVVAVILDMCGCVPVCVAIIQYTPLDLAKLFFSLLIKIGNCFWFLGFFQPAWLTIYLHGPTSRPSQLPPSIS